MSYNYYNNNHGGQPSSGPYWNSQSQAQQQQELNHRPSNVSAISDFDTPYDANGQPLRGRESIVSLDSDYDRRQSIWDPTQGTQTYDQAYAQTYNQNQSQSQSQNQTRHPYSAQQQPGSGWNSSFSYASRVGYAPAPNTEGHVSRTLSKGRKPSYAAVSQTVPESIEEEEAYDLSLIKTAAPMGAASGKYEPIREVVEEDTIPAFDFTTSLGPMTGQDAEFLQKLQEQEAQGRLTGGLGQGFKSSGTTRLRGEELLTSPVAMQRNLSRSFSRRLPARKLSRAETIKSIGQDEANRRGEVIEVVIEEPAETDLSQLEGPDMFNVDERRRSTMYAKEKMTQVFYPQPNWKPWPMRWPYLSMLVFISLALGVMQEVLFQLYQHKHLISFVSPNEIASGAYFAVKFAPTIAAVVYGVLWQFVDFEVRRLEAFYQLSKKGGALAGESINLDYATSFNFFRPFRAIRKGHHAVAISSVATILAVSLVPTFAAAAVVLSPSRQQRMAHPLLEKSLSFSPVFSRLLTATLVVCAVLGLGLFYMLQSRRSGLLSDVRGIAGLASMAVVSHILMDFKDMDTANHDDIHHRLKHHRYVLRNSSFAPDDENPVTSKERDLYDDHHLSSHPHPVMMRSKGILSMIAGLLLFMGFIPTVLFSPASVVTNKAPFVVTLLAVGLKMAWGGMETAVRMMEPFYILSKRHAPAKTLTLDYTALPFAWMPVRALINGHMLVFFVGFGSVMVEFLTILVTGLATVDGHDFLLEYKNDDPDHDGDNDSARQINSGPETVRSFYLSLVIALFILLYMSVVATIVFLRRRHPFLPRQPTTIASVLAYIHQSKMLYDFVGTEKLGNSEKLRKLERADGGKVTYGLGWFVGRDGQKHCGVDQEELISNYKHGIDFKQGIQPWDVAWDVL